MLLVSLYAGRSRRTLAQIRILRSLFALDPML